MKVEWLILGEWSMTVFTFFFLPISLAQLFLLFSNFALCYILYTFGFELDHALRHTR